MVYGLVSLVSGFGVLCVSFFDSNSIISFINNKNNLVDYLTRSGARPAQNRADRAAGAPAGRAAGERAGLVDFNNYKTSNRLQ